MPTSEQAKRPTIGIITALPKEYAAMDVLLENGKNYVVPGVGAGRRYRVGEIPTEDSGKHFVVLSYAGMGNNVAALRAARLFEHFPSITSIIMVGIAGGVPYPEKVDDHVRLGDVVVSNEGGVIQYDFGKESLEEGAIKIELRYPPRPPSAALLQSVGLLEAIERTGERPWLSLITQACDRLEVTRPSTDLDILADSADQNKTIPHPDDPARREEEPRIFFGPIASANILLKNPHKRDDLRDKFGVKAVEMEGSGIADTTWHYEMGYLVVRGICDYCDSNKNDIWQDYAAIVAAAYTRALLESIPSAQIRPLSLNGTSTSGVVQKLFRILIRFFPMKSTKLVFENSSEIGDLISQLNLWKEVHHSLQEAFEEVTRLSATLDSLRSQMKRGVPFEDIDVMPLERDWSQCYPKLIETGDILGELKQQRPKLVTDYQTVNETINEVHKIIFELSYPDDLINLARLFIDLTSPIRSIFRAADKEMKKLAEEMRILWKTSEEGRGE